MSGSLTTGLIHSSLFREWLAAEVMDDNFDVMQLEHDDDDPERVRHATSRMNMSLEAF